MTRQLLPSLFVIFALVSCAAPTPTPASTNTPAPTATAVLPTETPAPLPSPTVTVTATPEIRFTRQCLQENPNPVALKDLASGVVSLFPYLLNIQKETKNKIPTQQLNSEYYGDLQVSPNGNVLVYIEDIINSELEFTEYILWVVDAQAKVIAKISFKQQYIGSPRWLDNERILLYTSQTDDDGTALVVNPFTGEQRTVSNELPKLLSGGLVFSLGWRVEYSPNLEWVAYFYVHKSIESGIIVRDLVTGQNLWKSTGGGLYRPAWSPDSEIVAVIDSSEDQLYLVNRSGQAKLLTPEKKRYAAAPSWSPDGKQLAFWNDHSLMVYDRQSKQVIDLCIPSGMQGAAILPTPLWSPDGQQLVVYHIALVDLQKRIYYTHDGPITTITGWMNSIP